MDLKKLVQSFSNAGLNMLATDYGADKAAQLQPVINRMIADFKNAHGREPNVQETLQIGRAASQEVFGSQQPGEAKQP